MPAAAPDFLSFNGVVAIVVILILLGRALDWILLKSHQAAILRRATKAGKVLQTANVAAAQKALIEALISFIYRVTVPWSTRRLQTIATKSDQELETKDIMLLALAPLALLAMTIISLTILILTAAGVTGSWFWAMMTIPCTTVVLRFLVWWCRLFGHQTENEYNKPVPWVRWLMESKLVNWFMGLATRASLLSVLLSSLAISIGTSTAETEASSFWFTYGPSGLQPTHPILQALVNMPFDLLSLYCTVFLLTYGLRRGLPITLVVIIDVAATVILVILLHATVLTIASGSLTAIGDVLRQCGGILAQALTLQLSVADPDWPIYPILYTTFFPIGVYLLLPLIVGWIIRPAFRIAGYLCLLFGEKEKTPFFELATGLSLLVATTKALAEWEWFIHVIS